MGAQNKGVVVDTGGNVWFAAASDDPAKDCVYCFGPDGTRKKFQGGGMHGPWGITLTGGSNLSVGNFGSMLPGNVPERHRISDAQGQAPDARTIAARALRLKRAKRFPSHAK